VPRDRFPCSVSNRDHPRTPLWEISERSSENGYKIKKCLGAQDIEWLVRSKYFSIMAPYTSTRAEPSSSGFELQSLPASENPSQKKIEIGDLEDVRGDAAPPNTAVEALQTWHSPLINIFKVLATFWSFFVFGMNDGAYGVRILCLYHGMKNTDLYRLWFLTYGMSYLI
jgi:hypothetical protein